MHDTNLFEDPRGAGEFEPVSRSPMNLGSQKQLGAFYTCPDTAEFLAHWAIRKAGVSVLEPSFGSGIFLRAIRKVESRRGPVSIVGAELDEGEHQRAVSSWFRDGDRAHRGDFLSMPPVKVDAVVGNPPYVRLRHVDEAQSTAAQLVSTREMGHPMDTSGSLWMPFVLHCLRCLRPGGRMALVLPFELTYVKYARPLWRVLGERFGSIEVVRVHERLFPDILQDVVLLLADEYGGTTDTAVLRLHDRLNGLLAGDAGSCTSVSIPAVVGGDRAFLSAHLPTRLGDLLAEKVRPHLVPIKNRCAFNIGYVSGHKDYFHPNVDVQGDYALPSDALVPSIASGRQLKGAGLYTSGVNASRRSHLYLPNPERLAAGERRYIEYGERVGVADRYKCRVRSPWFVVPWVRVPDLILSVFAERPVLLENDASLVATNSLLTGFLKEGVDARSFIASWYTSLTLLGCEMEVHSLGGGVLVLIPGEVGKIGVAKLAAVPAAHFARLDKALRRGELENAYELGDDVVLRQHLGLTAAEVDLVRQGTRRLVHWRTAARGGLRGIGSSESEE